MSFASASLSNPIGENYIPGTPVFGIVNQFISPTITLTSSGVIVPAQQYQFNIGSGMWLIELNITLDTNATVDFTGYPFYIRLSDSLGIDVYQQTANLGGTFTGNPTLTQNLMTFDVAFPATPYTVTSNQPYTVSVYGQYAGADPNVQIKVFCYKLC